jgi:hypothetical protein
VDVVEVESVETKGDIESKGEESQMAAFVENKAREFERERF